MRRAVAAPITPGWLDPADVIAWLRLNTPTPPDAAIVADVALAAEPQCEAARPEFAAPVDPPTDPPSSTYTPDREVYMAAVMLAARLYQRRNSPGGIEGFGDMGAIYITRWDNEIDRALRVGNWRRAVLG
jgi:hypothetical protein